MNLTDIEAIRQLLDMAESAGLDLTSVRFGGPEGVSVTFSRQTPEPRFQGVVPQPQTSDGKVTIPERTSQSVYDSPVLWAGGRAPNFPTPGL